MTLEDHWCQLNASARFAIEMGMEKDKNDDEMEVILRWAEIKTQYENGLASKMRKHLRMKTMFSC